MEGMIDEVVLDEEWVRNDSMEIQKIISTLNGKKYSDYLELSIELRRFVDEFDPFHKETVIEYIFKQLRPEHQALFNPVNVITSEHRPQRWWSGCFSRTERGQRLEQS
jgi:hypothetical protein